MSFFTTALVKLQGVAEFVFGQVMSFLFVNI